MWKKGFIFSRMQILWVSDHKMKTIKLTDRQRDALYSVIRPYAEGIATLKNSKGDENCFKTFKGRLISADESFEIMEMLEE